MSQPSFAEQSKTERQSRPFLVTVIALLHFASACGLITALCLRASAQPESVALADSLRADLIYLPLGEAASPSLHEFDLPQDPTYLIEDMLLGVPAAGFAAYLGFALLRMKRGARALTVVSTGLAIVLWGQKLMTMLFFSKIGEISPAAPPTVATISIAIFVNGFICLYLMYGNDVAKIFADQV